MAILTILLSLIPSFAWLFFFLREDIHPEPRRMIAKVFVFGILITIPATALQYALKGALGQQASAQYSFISFLLFALIEEVLKFAVVWYTVSRSEFFDEPLDAMVYMITAALGFALVENVAVALGIDTLGGVFTALTLRFVGATLLHALSSSIVGYYWAISLIQKNRGRFSGDFIVTMGLLLASVLHAIFNYLIISLNDALVYPTIFLIFIAMFVFFDFEKLKVSKLAINHKSG